MPVKVCGRSLDPDKVILCPYGHPFGYAELTGSNIGLCINFGCDLPKLLRDLLLRFLRSAAKTEAHLYDLHLPLGEPGQCLAQQLMVHVILHRAHDRI